VASGRMDRSDDHLKCPSPNLRLRVGEGFFQLRIGDAAESVECTDGSGPDRWLHISKASTGFRWVSQVPGQDHLLAAECTFIGRRWFGVLVAGRHRSADGLFE